MREKRGRNGERSQLLSQRSSRTHEDVESTQVQGREFKRGMIILEGLVASIWQCQNNREIDLNWIFMIEKANIESIFR